MNHINYKMKLTDFKILKPSKTVLDEIAPNLKIHPHDGIKQPDIQYKKFRSVPYKLQDINYHKRAIPKYSIKPSYEAFTNPKIHKSKHPTAKEDFMYKYVGIPKWTDKHKPSTLYYEKKLKGKTDKDILVHNLQEKDKQFSDSRQAFLSQYESLLDQDEPKQPKARPIFDDATLAKIEKRKEKQRLKADRESMMKEDINIRPKPTEEQEGMMKEDKNVIPIIEENNKRLKASNKIKKFIKNKIQVKPVVETTPITETTSEIVKSEPKKESQEYGSNPETIRQEIESFKNDKNLSNYLLGSFKKFKEILSMIGPMEIRSHLKSRAIKNDDLDEFLLMNLNFNKLTSIKKKEQKIDKIFELMEGGYTPPDTNVSSVSEEKQRIEKKIKRSAKK